MAKALNAGVDIICAQGGEGGGHTGDVATSILIPKVVDLCRGHFSPLTGLPVYVVAAGGIFDGRGLAMALCFGAQAVWVGTRFVCATEAGAPPRHQKAIVDADYHDTVRTTIFTGRPMRVLKNELIMRWEDNEPQEIRALINQGVIPIMRDYNNDENPLPSEYRPLLMGQAAGAISDIKPAADIIEEIMAGAVETIRKAHTFIRLPAKL